MAKKTEDLSARIAVSVTYRERRFEFFSRDDANSINSPEMRAAKLKRLAILTLARCKTLKCALTIPLLFGERARAHGK